MLKKFAAACFCVGLSACGFAPVYAPANNNREVTADFAAIQIDVISDRSGQILRNELIDRLNAKGRTTSKYRLNVILTEQQIGLAIARDATLTRTQTIEIGDINLIDIQTGKSLLARHLSASSTYNVLPSQFSTLVTEQDSKERSLRMLADQITTALSLYFKNQQQ